MIYNLIYIFDLDFGCLKRGRNSVESSEFGLDYVGNSYFGILLWM